jgi:hypothetical protein
MRYPISVLSAQLTHVIIITAVIGGNHEVKTENSQFGNIRMLCNTLDDF